MSNIAGALYRVTKITSAKTKWSAAGEWGQCHASVSSNSHVFKWLRKEVTSCSHKVFSSRPTCLRLFCYPPSVSHHRDIVSFFSASHICFVQNAECIVRVHRPTHYRRRDVTCTAFTCVFAYLQPFCQLKRKEFCNLLWFHVKSAIYLRL